MSTTTLPIEKKNARQAHRTADAAGKQLLENLFGKEVFSENIKDRVKTFKDACEITGIDPSTVLDANLSPDEVAYRKIKIITQALNEGWKPDWNNSSEYKYYPYFDMRGSFSYHDYDFWYPLSHVGSRLCFKSADLAIYAGQQFTDIYKDFMTFQS